MRNTDPYPLITTAVPEMGVEPASGQTVPTKFIRFRAAVCNEKQTCPFSLVAIEYSPTKSATTSHQRSLLCQTPPQTREGRAQATTKILCVGSFTVNLPGLDSKSACVFTVKPGSLYFGAERLFFVVYSKLWSFLQ